MKRVTHPTITDYRALKRHIVLSGLVQKQYLGALELFLLADLDTHLTLEEITQVLNCCMGFARKAVRHFEDIGFVYRHIHRHGPRPVNHFIVFEQPVSKQIAAEFIANIDFLELEYSENLRNSKGKVQFGSHKS